MDDRCAPRRWFVIIIRAMEQGPVAVEGWHAAKNCNHLTPMFCNNLFLIKISRNHRPSTCLMLFLSPVVVKNSKKVCWLGFGLVGVCGFYFGRLPVNPTDLDPILSGLYRYSFMNIITNGLSARPWDL